MEEAIDIGLLDAFQALQVQLQVKKKLMANRERCVKLQKANKSLKKELDKVEKAKREFKEEALKESDKAALLEEELKKTNEALTKRGE
ncbi:hypothetical protein Q3G72_015514 [Acer saccharum]|nr:hypothetical protein Q3G72_015514 [Acer saccharum]